VVRASAKYDTVAVAQALLFEVIAQDRGSHLTTDELVRRIVANPDDSREVGTAKKALRDLRESALVWCGDDDLVKPTKAALHADSLFGT
jgi:hypothetical protein